MCICMWLFCTGTGFLIWVICSSAASLWPTYFFPPSTELLSQWLYLTPLTVEVLLLRQAPLRTGSFKDVSRYIPWWPVGSRGLLHSCSTNHSSGEAPPGFCFQEVSVREAGYVSAQRCPKLSRTHTTGSPFGNFKSQAPRSRSRLLSEPPKHPSCSFLVTMDVQQHDIVSCYVAWRWESSLAPFSEVWVGPCRIEKGGAYLPFIVFILADSWLKCRQQEKFHLHPMEIC